MIYGRRWFISPSRLRNVLLPDASASTDRRGRTNGIPRTSTSLIYRSGPRFPVPSAIWSSAACSVQLRFVSLRPDIEGDYADDDDPLVVR